MIEYFVQGSFNKKQVNQQILRSLPGLMATLDLGRLTGASSDGDLSIDQSKLENFYRRYNGSLIHIDDEN